MNDSKHKCSQIRKLIWANSHSLSFHDVDNLMLIRVIIQKKRSWERLADKIQPEFEVKPMWTHFIEHESNCNLFSFLELLVLRQEHTCILVAVVICSEPEYSTWCICPIISGPLHSSQWTIYPSLANERRASESSQWSRRFTYSSLRRSWDPMGLCHTDCLDYPTTWSRGWYESSCRLCFLVKKVLKNIKFWQPVFDS